MKVALFIPCYVDQFYPQVGIASLELLEKFGYSVAYPTRQTCCGQPMANSGYEHLNEPINEQFIDHFSEYDYVVCPSGSCVLHVKEHLHSAKREQEATAVRGRVYELVEFLHDVLQVQSLEASFPYKVALHASCHGLRGLRLATAPELNKPYFNKTEALLKKVAGLELVPLSQPGECCGFGGTFAVGEEALSVKMGKDKLRDHIENRAEVITGGDMSCLMHLEGIVKRNKLPLKVKHVAEILNGTTV